MTDDETRPFNAIGSGIELGVDLGKRGVLRPSIFVSGQIYGVLGDRTIGMDSRYADAGGAETATWEYEVGPLIYRVNLGLRVAWTGP